MMQALLKTATAALIALATAAQAQVPRQKHDPKHPEPAAPAVATDKRDRVVAASGTFNGHPYWLALAQCGGIYFRLNIFYTDIAVQARVVKPDPKINAEYSKN